MPWILRSCVCLLALQHALACAVLSDRPRPASNAPRSARGGMPGGPSSGPAVTVDFAQRVAGVKSMSGFLEGSAGQPADELINAVRPALWRIANQWRDCRDRLAEEKIPMIMSLSHTWGFGDDKTPIRDYSAWEAHVRQIAREGRRYNFVWDIWNEPDSQMFWKGTRKQWFEAFGHAAKALREELGPQAVISGPSLAQYDPAFVAEFLNYCRVNRIRLDVLSWHELSADANIPSVTAHLVDARQRFVNNAAYRGLGIRKVQINEIIGPTAQFWPAEILAYFTALEGGGADGACKACWGDSKNRGWVNCGNSTLNGILTPDTRQPRAAWWAYKAYADSVSSRVRSSSSDQRIVSFASRGAADGPPPQVVVAYFAYGDSPSATSVVLRMQHLRAIPSLGRTRTVRVKFERIPDSGEQALPALPIVDEKTVREVNGGVELRLDGLRLHEALVVTLSADR